MILAAIPVSLSPWLTRAALINWRGCMIASETLVMDASSLPVLDQKNNNKRARESFQIQNGQIQNDCVPFPAYLHTYYNHIYIILICLLLSRFFLPTALL